jgi:hypothetical protein
MYKCLFPYLDSFTVVIQENVVVLKKHTVNYLILNECHMWTLLSVGSGEKVCVKREKMYWMGQFEQLWA